MEKRYLSQQGFQNMLQLSKDRTPPPAEIQELRDRIEIATKAAEIRATSTGVIDEIAVQEIVHMKLQLDSLYGKWAEGELRGPPKIIIAH